MMSSPRGDFSRDSLRTRTNSRPGQHLIVGANDHGGDRALNFDRLGGGKQADQFVETLAIAQAMARQRVEGADLRARSGHARDPARDDAKLVDVGDRSMAQINLRDRDLGVVATGQRLQNASAALRASQACQRGRMRHTGRLVTATATGDSVPDPARDPRSTSRSGRLRASLRNFAPAGHRPCAPARRAGPPATASPACPRAAIMRARIRG